MLAQPIPERRRPRTPLSLRQQYEEFILERIEDFKNQLAREQLLGLADEAVRELEVGPEEQLVLTEVLVLEHVDRLIMRRLKLPTFGRWRGRHVRMRRAQREPAHWGLPSDTPLTDLVRRLEQDDLALVVGAGASPCAFFLAAHEAAVLVIDATLAGVEAVEARAAAEALASRIQALVVNLGAWFPDAAPALVILDPTVLTALDATRRVHFVETVQEHTVRGGVHLILPSEDRRRDVHALAPEAMQSQYRGWSIQKSVTAGRTRWFQATKP